MNFGARRVVARIRRLPETNSESATIEGRSHENANCHVMGSSGRIGSEQRANDTQRQRTYVGIHVDDLAVAPVLEFESRFALCQHLRIASDRVSGEHGSSANLESGSGVGSRSVDTGTRCIRTKQVLQALLHFSKTGLTFASPSCSS